MGESMSRKKERRQANKVRKTMTTSAKAACKASARREKKAGRNISGLMGRVASLAATDREIGLWLVGDALRLAMKWRCYFFDLANLAVPEVQDGTFLLLSPDEQLTCVQNVEKEIALSRDQYLEQLLGLWHRMVVALVYDDQPTSWLTALETTCKLQIDSRPLGSEWNWSNAMRRFREMLSHLSKVLGDSSSINAPRTGVTREISRFFGALSWRHYPEGRYDSSIHIISLWCHLRLDWMLDVKRFCGDRTIDLLYRMEHDAEPLPFESWEDYASREADVLFHDAPPKRAMFPYPTFSNIQVYWDEREMLHAHRMRIGEEV